MLPPECQVCGNFDVSLMVCCGNRAKSEHFDEDIVSFVLREYPGAPAGIDNGLFRLLNDDMRYEVRALFEDTMTWSAAYALEQHHGRLPRGLVRMAQTSAFVHIRVLGNFLLGYVDRTNENHPCDFGVRPGCSTILDRWRRSINSNVLHLNKLRPAPEVERYGKTHYPPTGVHLEVERLTDEVLRLWRDFVRDPAMKPYSKLLDHINADARHHAEAVRKRVAELLSIDEDDIPWGPPQP